MKELKLSSLQTASQEEWAAENDGLPAGAALYSIWWISEVNWLPSTARCHPWPLPLGAAIAGVAVLSVLLIFSSMTVPVFDTISLHFIPPLLCWFPSTCWFSHFTAHIFAKWMKWIVSKCSFDSNQSSSSSFDSNQSHLPVRCVLSSYTCHGFIGEERWNLVSSLVLCGFYEGIMTLCYPVNGR